MNSSNIRITLRTCDINLSLLPNLLCRRLCANCVCVCVCVSVYMGMRSCWVMPDSATPLGSSILGILQARTLEWVAISFSSGSPQPRYQTHSPLHWQADSLSLAAPGNFPFLWRIFWWFFAFPFNILNMSPHSPFAFTVSYQESDAILILVSW